jgi:hypothetical protein
MPLLEPGLHPEQCYKNSPFLFWTIVAVASRRYVDDVALLDSLSEPVTSLGGKLSPPGLTHGLLLKLL